MKNEKGDLEKLNFEKKILNLENELKLLKEEKANSNSKENSSDGSLKNLLKIIEESNTYIIFR